MEQPNYLDGFIQQSKEELSDEDWTVSRWLQWMKLNKYKIINERDEQRNSTNQQEKTSEASE